MTDDWTFVKRLRDLNDHMNTFILDEAADRIEQLEAANLKAGLIKVDDMARIEQLEVVLGELNAITDDAVDRIFQLEAAIDDLLQYVSCADWHYLKPETIKAMEDRAHD